MSVYISRGYGDILGEISSPVREGSGLLLELEVDGEGVPYGHSLTIHLTGNESR